MTLARFLFPDADDTLLNQWYIDQAVALLNRGLSELVLAVETTR